MHMAMHPWLKTSSTSSNPEAHRLLFKDSDSTLELAGLSSQSAIRITDDDHNDVHEHICDPTTYTTPSVPDALEANPFATLGDVKLLGRSTQPASTGRFLTPHDNILVDVQGRLPSVAPPEQQPLQPDLPLGSSFNLGSSPLDTSLFTTESLPSREPAKEIMYDPSTGQRLYDYVPTPARSGTDDELWSHLSHILELQSEIAKMHVDMENVGLRTARGHNGSGVPERGGNADASRSETRKHRGGGETLVEEEDSDETDGATEGEEPDGNEVFGKRKRDEEFTRLFERFAERKVAIDSVMCKLDDLSSALKTFHALPTPVLDLASSRTNTTSSNATTDHGTSGTPVVTSTTPAPPRLSTKPLVTTIIDDSQHIDSPLEMNTTQYIIDRNFGKK